MIRLLFAALFLALGGGLAARTSADDPTGDAQLETGIRIADRLLSDEFTRANYRYELGLEACLSFAEATDNPELRERTLERISKLNFAPAKIVPWRRQPFGSLTYAVYRTTGDDRWLNSFLDQTDEMVQQIWRNEQGAVLHPRGTSRGGGYAMLIDAMQEYSARLARASLHGDEDYLEEVAKQWSRYRAELRDPEHGLWSQGKGWLSDQPTAVSPGAWSRGHGWMLRGLVATLRAMPADAEETQQVMNVYRELCQSLLPIQQPDGSWHALLNRPAEQSPIDISGTAMIATAFSQGAGQGWLDQRFAKAAERSFSLIPNYVNDQAEVISVSPGPGPLQSEQDYLVEQFPIDNDHGLFSVLFAMAEAQRR